MDRDLNYMEEKYQSTHWYGYEKKLDEPIVLINLFKCNTGGESMSVYLNKEGAAIIGKWLLEFAESPDERGKV